MKLERLLENLIKLKLTKEIDKIEQKEKTPKEKLLEMYTSPQEDAKENQSVGDIVLSKIKVLAQKPIKKEPSLKEKAQQRDRDISEKRAMLEAK
jgi:site-specific recombinase